MEDLKRIARDARDEVSHLQTQIRVKELQVVRLQHEICTVEKGAKQSCERPDTLSRLMAKNERLHRSIDAVRLALEREQAELALTRARGELRTLRWSVGLRQASLQRSQRARTAHVAAPTPLSSSAVSQRSGGESCMPSRLPDRTPGGDILLLNTAYSTATAVASRQATPAVGAEMLRLRAQREQRCRGSIAQIRERLRRTRVSDQPTACSSSLEQTNLGSDVALTPNVPTCISAFAFEEDTSRSWVLPQSLLSRALSDPLIDVGGEPNMAVTRRRSNSANEEIVHGWLSSCSGSQDTAPSRSMASGSTIDYEMYKDLSGYESDNTSVAACDGSDSNDDSGNLTLFALDEDKPT